MEITFLTKLLMTNNKVLILFACIIVQMLLNSCDPYTCQIEGLSSVYSKKYTENTSIIHCINYAQQCAIDDTTIVLLKYAGTKINISIYTKAGKELYENTEHIDRTIPIELGNCMNTYVIRKLVINKAYTKVEFRDYFCNERKCYLLFLTQKPVFVDGYYFDCLVNNFNLKKFPFVKGIDKNVYVFCKEE